MASPQASTKQDCFCWKCFLQAQFAPLLLLVYLVYMGTLLLHVMYNFKDEADIVWIQMKFGEIQAAFLGVLGTAVVAKAMNHEHSGDTIKGDNTVVVQAATEKDTPNV